MKVIIAGSRTITEYFTVKDAVEQSPFWNDITVILSGGAKGVDTLGEAYGKMYNIEVETYPADWLNWGKKAGIIRNKLMGDSADALIAVWDGKSKGTKHMIDYMKELKKPVYIYYVENN